jgi:hypothetical protein
MPNSLISSPRLLFKNLVGGVRLVMIHAGMLGNRRSKNFNSLLDLYSLHIYSGIY